MIYSKHYFENFNNACCTGPQQKALFHPQGSCDMLYCDLLLRSVKEMQMMLIFFLSFCMTVTFYVNFICSLSSQSQNILWEAEWCHFSHSIIFQLLEQDILWHILQYFLKVVKYKLKVIYLCMRGLHCLFQLLELNRRFKVTSLLLHQVFLLWSLRTQNNVDQVIPFPVIVTTIR